MNAATLARLIDVLSALLEPLAGARRELREMRIRLAAAEAETAQLRELILSCTRDQLDDRIRLAELAAGSTTKWGLRRSHAEATQLSEQQRP